MADGRRNNGGHPNAGRKPKAEEQELIEKLAPLEPLALKALEKALKEDKPWAVRLFLNYKWGKPRETKEIQMESQDVPIFQINYLD
jgi:hypothetical protein